MDSPFGEQSITEVLQSVLGRMDLMETAQTNLEMGIEAFATSLINVLTNFMVSFATNGIADAAAQIPYIGPLLATLIRSLTPQLAIQSLDGLCF